MLSKIKCAQIVGLSPCIVDIETDISRGMKSFSIVGLPDKAIDEAKDRVIAAIKNSELPEPNSGNRKIIVALSPADIKKEGPVFDLGIAIGLLSANKTIDNPPVTTMILGELALDGNLRPIKGALVFADYAKRNGFNELFLPMENAKEASLINGLTVYGVKTLKDIAFHFNYRQKTEAPTKNHFVKLTPTNSAGDISKNNAEAEIDFSDIAGAEDAKRAIEIAAAGGHNLMMYGPPGTGKTMLAKAMIGIIPDLSFDEIIKVTGIHSTVRNLNNQLITSPPFRAPHHTSSYASLVGGGAWPKPGEITLAHRGVLFLDEFPEFDKRVIETLRQPLEEKSIHISRAKNSTVFPSDFILIIAMNPCPCGNKNDSEKQCICDQSALLKYQRKISGPIADRIDLWVEVPRIKHERLLNNKLTGNESPKIKEKVGEARIIQKERLLKFNITKNADIAAKNIKEVLPLDDGTKQLLVSSAERLNLSARSFHRIIKVARTIADLEKEKNISEKHILEALRYRPNKSHF